jgi:outer membrane protein TolC
MHIPKTTVNTFYVGLLLLSVMIRSHASEKDEARRVVDSLEAVYETLDADLSRLDSAAGLADYLVVAASRNPGLRAAFYRWKAALEKSGYAGTLPDPVFSYRYFIESVETRVGPQQQGLSLRQSFPWFGTLAAQGDVEFEAAAAAHQEFLSKKLRLNYLVKSAFYEYYYLGQEMALTRENLELMKFWEAVSRARYKAALTAHPDVIRAQLELGKLEDRVHTLEDRLGPMRSRIRALLNLPDSVTLPLPGRIETEAEMYDVDSLKKTVRGSNPHILYLRHLKEKEAAGVRLAKNSSYPGFTVGLDYIQTGPAPDPALPESGKDPWIIGVSVNLPIWFGKNSAKTEEARAREKEVEYKLKEARNQLDAHAEGLLSQYDDALRKLRLYRDGLVPKAEQSLNTSYTAYRAGELEFLNVLDAQRQLLVFQLQLERARADLGIRSAELEMLAGRD